MKFRVFGGLTSQLGVEGSQLVEHCLEGVADVIDDLATLHI